MCGTGEALCPGRVPLILRPRNRRHRTQSTSVILHSASMLAGELPLITPGCGTCNLLAAWAWAWAVLRWMRPNKRFSYPIWAKIPPSLQRSEVCSESGGIAPTTSEEPLAALFSELPAFQECQKRHWPHPQSCIGRILAALLVACAELSNVGQPPPTGMLYIVT